MTNTNATNFRQNVFEYLNQAIMYNDVVNINTKNGNAVVISEEEYNGLLESLYLLSDQRVRQEIIEGMHTPLSDCIPADEVQW